MVLRTHAQSWNVLRNSRIVRQRKDSYIALRNTRIAQIPTSRGTYIYSNSHLIKGTLPSATITGIESKSIKLFPADVDLAPRIAILSMILKG